MNSRTSDTSPPQCSSPTRKNVAIDYDGHYAEDPEWFDAIIESGIKRGHRFFIVTCRVKPNENDSDFEPSDFIFVKGCTVIYTSLAAKKPYMDRLGIKIDFWWDDEPFYIYNSRSHYDPTDHFS